MLEGLTRVFVYLGVDLTSKTGMSAFCSHLHISINGRSAQSDSPYRTPYRYCVADYRARLKLGHIICNGINKQKNWRRCDYCKVRMHLHTEMLPELTKAINPWLWT